MPPQIFHHHQYQHPMPQPTLQPMFTPGQDQQMLRMLDQTSISESHGTANIAGNFSLSQGSSMKWIVDTEASHHMIGDSHVLHNKGLLDNVGHVQLPTGDSAKVSHVGDCHIGGGDILRKVLCVPSFQFNLMSVSQVTKDLNCVTFFHNIVFFRTSCLGRSR